MAGGVVYLIRARHGKKVYVGSTRKKAGYRWNQHLRSLQRGTHRSRALQDYFDSHGEFALEFVVVEVWTDPTRLKEREQLLIDKHRAHLFNGRHWSTNHDRTGEKMPASAKAKISTSLKGNQRRTGKPHSADDKRKISEAMKRAHAEGRHPGFPTQGRG